MKKAILLLLVVHCALSSPCQELRHNALTFLVGNYTVKVMRPDANGKWKHIGIGEASFTAILNGAFLKEEINLKFSNASMHMYNTLGKDGRTGNWRLFALDQEYSVMDVYDGKEIAGKLIFNNLNSDSPAETPNGEKLNFRITFSKNSHQENQSLVEMTKDGGRTWKIFSKQLFTRKSENSK